MPEDKRLSGEEAGLIHVGVLGSSCFRCEFWHSDQSCDLVKGRIPGTMCCDGYQGKGDAPKNDYKFSAGSAFLPALRAVKSDDLRSE